MERLGFEPEVVVSDIPEQIRDGESAADYTDRLARQKAADVVSKLAGETGYSNWLLAADTVVTLDDALLEKPRDEAEAVDMLEKLSGSRHKVITSFCWMSRGSDARSVRRVETFVDFRQLERETVERYAATGEPLDKAGGYGIQDIGSAFVREVEGSYFAVVGLPVCEVVEELEALGGLSEYPFLPLAEGRADAT